MQVGQSHLTYCTNVHPGEGLADLHRILTEDVSTVKEMVCPTGPFGAGLRLGNSMVEALSASPADLDGLIRRCQALELYVFTVNGFPYGDFGSGVIKESVYSPDWNDEARVKYTIDLARILSRLPGPEYRTISTVAGGYGPQTRDRATRARMAENLSRVALALHEIAEETGVKIRLCLEPEPWTTLETTPGVIEFFDRWIHPIGPNAENHLGLCYDCCHQAVYFEDMAESVRALRDNGVVIGKVQVSSALHISDPGDPTIRQALLKYAEPRYLHQVAALGRDGILRARDLAELVNPSEAWRAAKAWRCPFHVPIWWRGDGELETTRDDWEAAVKAIIAGGDHPQFEIETYTWDVIPAAQRNQLGDGSVHRSVAMEFDALLPLLN